MPPGEQHKRLDTIETLLEELAQRGADRDSVLIALGGGVIGDMTGFLAAVYMRGIRYIGVPTTALAQIDSSVGGKTGVNLASGKNLVGAFHHPLAVYSDIATLSTLPPAELRAGLQEAVKAGIIRDRILFDFLDLNSTAVLSGDAAALTAVVSASVRVKAEIVGLDEKESGLRMILNLGHTLGHAIEAATGYQQLLHGEAVAWGMLAAIRIAAQRDLVSAAEAERMQRVIGDYGPLQPFTASAAELVALTAKDKKNRSGARAFVLPIKPEPGIKLDTGIEPEAGINPGARPANEATEIDAAAHVRGIFDSIAPRYDLLNHLLSMGLAAHWWRRAARKFKGILGRPDARILDLCCGTGDMTAALLALRPRSATGSATQPIQPVTGLDFSAEMLSRARAKYTSVHYNVRWVEADAMHLPYPDGSFDLVTSAFGFRNLTNYAAGLAEMHRVLRPGGRIGILECNQPGGLSGFAYGIYFRHILPIIGGWISGDAAAYRYLPASVARFPRPPLMLRMLAEAGFSEAGWDGYLLRAAGLYHAVKLPRP